MTRIKSFNIAAALLLSAVSGTASAADFFSAEKPSSLFDLGVRIGVNTSNRTLGGDVMPGYNRQSWGTGFDVGFTADLNFRDWFAIQPGVFFQSRSGDYTFVTPFDNTTVTQAGHFRSYSFTIPVMASLRFNVTDDIRWSLDFGPYVGFTFGSKLSDKALVATAFPNVEPVFTQKPAPVDFGLKFGTGLRILGHYYIGAHYQAGLTRAWKNLDLGEGMMRNFGGHTKAWVFTLGYDF